MVFTMSEYFLDIYGGASRFNFTPKIPVAVDDIVKVTIDDSVKFRPDLIARKYLGRTDLYFLILWFNRGITKVEGLDSGKTIDVPTQSWMNRNYDVMTRELAL